MKQIYEFNELGQISAVYDLGTNADEQVDSSCKTYYYYNTNGLQFRMYMYDKEQGEIISLNTYNSKGKILKKEVACIDPPTYTYIYEPYGKIIECKVTQKYPAMDPDGTSNGKVANVYTYRITYSYNAKGQLQTERTYNARQENKPLESYINFTYDIKGMVSKITRHNSEGTLWYINDFKYDTNGFLTDSWYAEDAKSPRVWSVYVWGK